MGSESTAPAAGADGDGDIRDAANRLFTADWNLYPENRTQRIAHAYRDAHRVARAWLRDHPADDGEAITEEWLRTVGFRSQEGHLTLVPQSRFDDGDGLIVRRLSTGEWNAEDGFSALLIPSPQSRGDVRRLCAILNIPLTEQPHDHR